MIIRVTKQGGYFWLQMCIYFAKKSVRGNRKIRSKTSLLDNKKRHNIKQDSTRSRDGERRKIKRSLFRSKRMLNLDTVLFLNNVTFQSLLKFDLIYLTY